MKKTAVRLDVFFRVLQIALSIAGVAALVGLLLITACLLLGLSPEQIGTGYDALEIGFVEFQLAADFVPERKLILGITAVELVSALAAVLLGRKGIACVRALIAPMKEGTPFHDAASGVLIRLAKLTLVLGVILNASEAMNQFLVNRLYGLNALLCSEKILRVRIHCDLDFTFILVSGILLLLAYVFRHGQELQQLSDETL